MDHGEIVLGQDGVVEKVIKEPWGLLQICV